MAACLEEQQESNMNEKRLHNMFLKIASSNVIVKTQQKDELDFTVEQKLDILKDILEKNPATFLMRFGQCISTDDLVYFENLDIEKNNFELMFRIKEVKNLLDDKKKHVHVQNRRYKALQRLMTGSNYFDENEMRRREPLLYEQYIGQYMTEDEKLERDRAEQYRNSTLSDVLLQRFDSRETEWIFQCQKEREEEERVEEDSDTDSETEHDCVTSPIKGIPSETERQLLKDEFLSEMQAKFLAGQDEGFDYTEVDMNDDYDDLKLRERDEEEAYFDDDDDDYKDDVNESEMKEI
ncbi:coiled-coil domain-containing protein 97-like [Actinia tenebrosa]|uniref:Coiled-coil domain-containing protein 97-like n=1 Tax=Actinia tenebrosa TaxID=6105 RepID=A0A6P8IYC4_ACTTE|nr:coiled-coil domain-containing protein 97-like [Actinia tenebrosa]